MAIGKNAKDLFQATSIELEPTPRTKGRPKAESYQKVTVCLFDRHVLWLDEEALRIRKKEGRKVRRAELIREMIEASMKKGSTA